MELDGVSVDEESLRVEVRRLADEDPERSVVIRGDRGTSHAEFMRAMHILREAGLTRFALNIESQGEP